MPIKQSSATLIFAATLLFASCAGKGAANPAAADTIDTIETVAAAELQPLPDTVYPSADAVKARVEVLDTAVSPLLTSLSDPYADAPGAFTFRKGQLRDASFGATVKGEPSELILDWVYTTPEDYTPTKYGAWGGGTGWTGQPLYVSWPDSCMQRLRADRLIADSASSREILVGSLSGRVCFIDFETGKPSRRPIDVMNPIKGTMSLDPSLNGNLYVGHGVPARGEFGAEVIDLYRNARSHFFGPDPKAQRRWGAYDSSPVRAGQFLFRPGENGTLYKFTVAPGRLKLHSALRYYAAGAVPGMEASMAVYLNYCYIADNAGNIICVNLNTLRPVWRYKLPDDIDSTPVIELEDGKPYLYTGCEVEHEGVTEACFVKLDALTGQKIWINRSPARRADVDTKHFDGGYYATCLPGRGDCANLIMVNLVHNTDGQNGSFVAIDRATGQTVYSTPLRYYAWSSPVGFLSDNGRLYVVTGDCAGNLYLISGRDGKIISRRPTGNNFESSPVAVGNSLVVGSRGKTVYKLSLK